MRVLPADKVAEMNNIMTHVVTEGTGRAAQIPGLVIAGKTGTTNHSTNAWFNAFTGNLVGSVWFGNDDNSSCENMTGGTLPAQTWREIMAFAHQGLGSQAAVWGGASACASANEKIVSLFEPHADIIVKGGREVQYGHKLNLTTGRSGLILEAALAQDPAKRRPERSGGPRRPAILFREEFAGRLERLPGRPVGLSVSKPRGPALTRGSDGCARPCTDRRHGPRS